MSAVNASFARLLEYEQRALGIDSASAEAEQTKGDWAGIAFRVADSRLVCSLDRISESLPMPPVTRVPGTKAFILGLANLHGDLITVVDLGCYLSGQRSTPSLRSRLLSASLRGRPVGLLVDEVFGQRNFFAGEADRPQLPDDSPLSHLAHKQHRAGSETWLELDLDRLFNDKEFLNGAAA